MIVITGDIVDKTHTSYGISMDFIKGAVKIAPVYYVTGNHEYWSTSDKFREEMEILDRYGVVRLQGCSEMLEINGNDILLAGVNDPDAFYQNETGGLDGQLAEVAADIPEGTYSILLSHRPDGARQDHPRPGECKQFG